jgi:hypothetical protein
MRRGGGVINEDAPASASLPWCECVELPNVCERDVGLLTQPDAIVFPMPCPTCGEYGQIVGWKDYLVKKSLAGSRRLLLELGCGGDQPHTYEMVVVPHDNDPDGAM